MLVHNTCSMGSAKGVGETGLGTSSDNLGNMLKGLNDNEGRLKYVHKVKSNKVTDLDELGNQVRGQVDSMNRIIENEGMSGLKNRITSYNVRLEAKGRAYVKTLDSAPDGFAWLHEPDMRTGGLPTDVTRIGSRRINSILGGQANRIAKDILNMSDEVTKIHWTIEIK